MAQRVRIALQNFELVDKVKEIANRHSATPGQVALAWLLAQGPDVVPIPGDQLGQRTSCAWVCGVRCCRAPSLIIWGRTHHGMAGSTG